MLYLTKEAIFLLFFFEANPDAVITPMREPRGGGKHWSPMVAGDYLMGRVDQVTLERSSPGHRS